MLRRNEFASSYVDNDSMRLLDFYADSWRHPKVLPHGWALEMRTAFGEAVPNRNSATATISPGHRAHVNHAHQDMHIFQTHSDKFERKCGEERSFQAGASIVQANRRLGAYDPIPRVERKDLCAHVPQRSGIWSARISACKRSRIGNYN